MIRLLRATPEEAIHTAIARIVSACAPADLDAILRDWRESVADGWDPEEAAIDALIGWDLPPDQIVEIVDEALDAA